MSEQLSNATPSPVVEPVLTAPVEQKPVEVVEAKEEKEIKEDPKMASKFAALAKREQRIRMQETSLKEKLSKISEYEMSDKLFNESPLEWLAKRGVTFDKLTQLALNDGKKPAEMQIRELEERLEREKKEREDRETESVKKRVEAQREEFFEGVKNFLKSNPEKYELSLTEEEGVPELIFEVMNIHKERTGRVLPLDQAADVVEKHFEGLLDQKFIKLNKIKSRFAQEKPADPVAPAATMDKKESPTLTNTQAASVATPSTNKILTLDDSKKEAAKLLKWV
jgi:hypothetical protein